MVVSDIQKSIRSRFNDHRYEIDNVFLYDWESDYFSIASSGYAYEFEIKVSRSDFKADFKKEWKHRVLSSVPEMIIRRGSEWTEWNSQLKLEIPHTTIDVIDLAKKKIPNRFFYACPEGLLKIEDMPPYAGLIYCKPDEMAQVIKQGPLLHKTVFNYEKELLEKYYFKCQTLKNQMAVLQGRLNLV